MLNPNEDSEEQFLKSLIVEKSMRYEGDLVFVRIGNMEHQFPATTDIWEVVDFRNRIIQQQ